LLVGEVSVVEESCEEDEVGGVHEQGVVDVLVGHAALQSGLLHLEEFLRVFHFRVEGSKFNENWAVRHRW